MSENKVKLSQAQFDALPEEAEIKIFVQHSKKWVLARYYSNFEGNPQIDWREIEICEEEVE